MIFSCRCGDWEADGAPSAGRCPGCGAFILAAQDEPAFTEEDSGSVARPDPGPAAGPGKVKKGGEMELEQVVKWALEQGFSTGHADTLEDLLEEVGEQVQDLRKEIISWRTYRNNIDQALNSGDGVYRP